MLYFGSNAAFFLCLKSLVNIPPTTMRLVTCMSNTLSTLNNTNLQINSKLKFYI